MRVDASQLANQVQQRLAPVYLISGDEPLLAEECCALVRDRARAAGYERTALTVESGFDWNALFADMYSPSLFSPRALYEVRLASGKPGDTGGAILAQLAQKPPPHTVLLVVTGKLDKTSQASKWVTALETAGVFVQVWPIEAARLPDWINRRLRAQGLSAEPAVTELLAYHMEGNLLAAAQEIDKLALLFPDQTIRADDVAEVLSDSSRFTVFGWVDACVGGDAGEVRRKLARLRTEGVEPILLLWAIARELRTLAQMALALKGGKNEQAVLAQFHVWANRKLLVSKALRRLPAGRCLGLLGQAARADRVLKGRAPGDIWHELERLGLACCAVPLPTAVQSTG